MQKLLLPIVLISISTILSAQIPTSCFEIESILVDACANPEGENEMVRFRTGPNPLPISDLSIQWANTMNPWLGTCRDATTALKVDSINQTIQGCGILIEPTSGILPAGSKVLLITSTKVQALAHSFTYLNDTLYVIFQCDSNTAGHFANGGPGLRSMIISFSQPLGCADTVSYNRSLLVNIYDSTGGTTASQNGSSVSYSWDGTPTYYNNGCVAPFIPVSVDAGNDTSVCEGTALQLNGSEESADALLWNSNQGTFNTANILNPIFTPNPNESYPILITLTAFTPCDSLIDTVLINKLTVSINAGSNQTICAGESAQLNGSGANSYSWSLNGTVFSNQPNPVVSPTTTTNYVLTGTDNIHSCVAKDSVIITVNQQDSLIVTSNANQICEGQQVSANVTGGNSYIWFPDDGNISDVTSSSPTLAPPISTTYFVASIGSCADTASITITVLQNDSIAANSDVNQICLGDTAQLSASGANNFMWSPDDGTISNVTIPNPVAYPVNSTIYTVMSLGGCPDTATVQLDVITPPNINITPSSATICSGKSVQLNVSGSNNVQWTPSGGLSCTTCIDPIANPVTTTTFLVSDNQCSVEDSVIITVLQSDSITANSDVNPICLGDTAQLSSSGTNNIIWSPDDGTISNINIPNPVAYPSNSTIYTVISLGGCPDTATVQLDVISPASVNITPSLATICSGESVQLNVSGSNNVQWTPSGGLSCTTCIDPIANPVTTTTFFVSDNQCSVEDSVTITVNLVPVISTSNDTTVLAGGSATLTASGGNTYSWSPDESLNNATTPSVIATPLETTVYTVTVSDNQCEAQASIVVTVILPVCPQPVIPSAFSPNNDSRNDRFGLVNSYNYVSAELHIYNRWGENVFNSVGFEKWDGFYKGELQPIGTFVYMLTATCPDSKKYESKGSVSLLK